MPSKTNHTNSKKHGQIVKTAETLFTRHGIKRITVEEICQKAGVSKMTFYKYFSNKTDLVAHICNNWIEEGFEKLDEINALDIPFPEKIEMMFKWRTELVSKMSTEFIEEVLPIDLEYGRITERILKFIVDAQKKGNIRPEIRPEFIAAVIDKMHDLARNEKLMRIYPSYIEFNRELKDFFWFGLLPRPPHPKE
jgi:AcrR family transcriptional regulator